MDCEYIIGLLLLFWVPTLDKEGFSLSFFGEPWARFGVLLFLLFFFFDDLWWLALISDCGGLALLGLEI